ncbi:MAG TPA: Rne/Rng family ribonuclease, partial [Candidatus Sumerlaeota bacterium]|nr:Rne/Rng family ribonuclease [Candidatus Sumerlaeota bacterium]
MRKRILINREEREVRVAFLEDQTLVELHTEKADEQSIVNNIYRGRVQDVVPGLQAAFVDVGLSRNMFLHFMDIRPESLVLGEEDQIEALRKASETVVPGRIERKGRRPRQDPNAPQASAPVKKGDQIIVQVLKDEIGGKAPRVTTNLSLAGRYLVMLPFPSQSGGVSRKIAMGQDRSRLRKLLSDLKTDDYSFIVRTAGTDQPDEAIHKDAENLQQTWDSILKRYRQINGPGLVNNDHDLIARLVRDAFPADFDEVICDNADDVEEAKFQLEEVLPGSGSKVKLYDGVENIFERHGVEKQIEKSLAKKYWLKSGGYLIIDENEALTAIDVNTGRFTGKKDQEKTSLRTNMEACEAIADQIRLRDIGGIIVI